MVIVNVCIDVIQFVGSIDSITCNQNTSIHAGTGKYVGQLFLDLLAVGTNAELSRQYVYRLNFVALRIS